MTSGASCPSPVSVPVCTRHLPAPTHSVDGLVLNVHFWGFPAYSCLFFHDSLEILITLPLRKPLSEVLGCLLLFGPQFPSYLKGYSGGFTLLSFWASPAEWEEVSQHAPCLRSCFSCRVRSRARAPQTQSWREQAGGPMQWPLAKI